MSKDAPLQTSNVVHQLTQRVKALKTSIAQLERKRPTLTAVRLTTEPPLDPKDGDVVLDSESGLPFYYYDAGWHPFGGPSGCHGAHMVIDTYNTPLVTNPVGDEPNCDLVIFDTDSYVITQSSKHRFQIPAGLGGLYIAHFQHYLQSTAMLPFALTTITEIVHSRIGNIGWNQWAAPQDVAPFQYPWRENDTRQSCSCIFAGEVGDIIQCSSFFKYSDILVTNEAPQADYFVHVEDTAIDRRTSFTLIRIGDIPTPAAFPNSEYHITPVWP